MNIEGDGGLIEYAVDVQGLAGLDQELANQAFFRVEVTEEPLSLLVLPKQDAQIEIQEGVCFAFNLNIFHQLPSKIRVYMKEDTPGSNWAPIGLLQDFNEIDGVKFLQGSVIWLPDQIGDYQVKVTAFDAADNIMEEVERDISVIENSGPSITLVSGNIVNIFPYYVKDLIQSIVHDAGAPLPCFAEFFDNGDFIGRSQISYLNGVLDYGDVTDMEGSLVQLNKGLHTITARVIDQRGVPGEISNPVNVHITQGNSRPVIEITSPTEDIYVNQGDYVTINFNFADPDGTGDISDIRVIRLEKSLSSYVGYPLEIQPFAPFTGSFTLDTSQWPWTNGANLLRVVATDSQGLKSYPAYLTVYVKTGFEHNLITELVDENTISLTGKEFFQGNPLSSGIFTGGNASGLGMTEPGPPSGIMDTGVALTTGYFSSWNGGDLIEDQSANMNTPGDEFLECRITTTGGQTFDAAIIEFDVNNQNGQLEMVYQFGSEEYIEYVSDNTECYNDSFLILVNGRITSLLPDCSDIVAVHSIHPEILVGEVTSCLDEDLESKNKFLYIDDSEIVSTTQVEYDGLTEWFKIHVLVSPNIFCKIRVVISDVNDPTLDSSVFIQTGSIKSIDPSL